MSSTTCNKPSSRQVVAGFGIVGNCIATVLLVSAIAVQRWNELDADDFGYEINIGLFQACVPHLSMCLSHSALDVGDSILTAIAVMCFISLFFLLLAIGFGIATLHYSDLHPKLTFAAAVTSLIASAFNLIGNAIQLKDLLDDYDASVFGLCLFLSIASQLVSMLAMFFFIIANHL